MAETKEKQIFELTYDGETHSFGGHKYGGANNDCAHGCGIWEHKEHGFMKVSAGIDPRGACPGNYLGSDEEMGEKTLRVHQDFIVNARIEMAEKNIKELGDSLLKVGELATTVRENVESIGRQLKESQGMFRVDDDG